MKLPRAKHTFLCTDTYVCVHIYMCTCLRCMCTCIHTHMCICIHAYTNVHVYIYTPVYVYTNTYIHIQAHKTNDLQVLCLDTQQTIRHACVCTGTYTFLISHLLSPLALALIPLKSIITKAPYFAAAHTSS